MMCSLCLKDLDDSNAISDVNVGIAHHDCLLEYEKIMKELAHLGKENS